MHSPTTEVKIQASFAIAGLAGIIYIAFVFSGCALHREPVENRCSLPESFSFCYRNDEGQEILINGATLTVTGSFDFSGSVGIFPSDLCTVVAGWQGQGRFSDCEDDTNGLSATVSELTHYCEGGDFYSLRPSFTLTIQSGTARITASGVEIWQGPGQGRRCDGP